MLLHAVHDSSIFQGGGELNDPWHLHTPGSRGHHNLSSLPWWIRGIAGPLSLSLVIQAGINLSFILTPCMSFLKDAVPHGG